MRKLLYAFGLTSALVFALAAHAAAPNFAGTWTLDKSKSQGLNPTYAERRERYLERSLKLTKRSRSKRR